MLPTLSFCVTHSFAVVDAEALLPQLGIACLAHLVWLIRNRREPSGKPLYVLFYATDKDFITTRGLKLVYHDSFSDAAIAIRPELDQ